MSIEIGRLIKSLADSDAYIGTIFTSGGCYRFHLFLKSIYPNAVPLMNENKDHVLTCLDGKVYDIDGISEEKCSAMSVEDVAIAEKWSFAGRQILSIGECRECEEPLLIYPSKREM